MIKKNATRGFVVQTIYGNNEFAPLKDWLVDQHKYCGTDAHILETNRSNCFLKKRIRYIRFNVPFRKTPRQVLIELVRITEVLINRMTSK